MMNLLETELRELAQTHLELIQDIQWHDLRRAVVIHLESLEEHDTLIVPRVATRQVCHHIINQKPCPKWTDGTPCGATWHPEFLQILEDGQPKWIWMPRQSICRTDQRSRGVRHQQGQLSCTDPNCLRAHAPNWLYAELWAFRWWVQHEFNTGLATGYTLNGDLIDMSTRTANLTLATMPYVDEAYYHKFRWHAQIPQPETYGDMIVTAPSRQANLHNEQPRRGRASTPRRHNTPKRHVTPPRPVVIRAEALPAPTPTAPTHPWLVRGSPAHTLWSHKYTQHIGTNLHHFFHPESPAHTDWSHVRTQPFSRVTRAHRLESQVHTGTILHHFFHAESPTHTSHGIGWGGVGMMTFFALAHMFKARAMDCFGTYFTHVQTCNVTRVQSATEWTASVHTLHICPNL